MTDRPTSSGSSEAGKAYHIRVEGTGLAYLLGQRNIDPERTQSTHVEEVYQTLGIEAARSVIIKELGRTMDDAGLRVDERHLSVIADWQTQCGMLVAVNRHGMPKMRSSLLSLASFETPLGFLPDAVRYQGSESAMQNSPTLSVMLGQMGHYGTGGWRLD